jgi:hypothetical protein
MKVRVGTGSVKIYFLQTVAFIGHTIASAYSASWYREHSDRQIDTKFLH